jgi:hypothetical protein
MEQRSTEQDLIEVLRALRATTIQLAREVQRPFEGLDIQLSRLKSIVADLGNARPARPMACHPDYQQQWKDYCRKNGEDLDAKAIKYLCWDAEVATDPRFDQYLHYRGVSLSARSLQGLVRSCHLRWNSDFACGPVAAQARERVYRYRGPNRVLEKWKTDLALILGSHGHERFAELLISNGSSPGELCEAWKLDESTAYTLDGVKCAVKTCLDRLNAPSAQQTRELELETYLCSKLLAWQKWPDGEFRECIARIVLSPFAEDGSCEELKKLILGDQRLGDPRQPRNEYKWEGYKDAKRRVTEWLSKDDISFFFEHVIPPGHNQLRRKAFWLAYAPSIRRSRPLLSRRHRAELKSQKEKIGNFGSYDHELTSAFVLDFGPVAVVEFSERGNACFIYERLAFDELVPGAELWANTPFSERQLKDQGKKRYKEKIRHDVHGHWVRTLMSLLARYGIWPSE